jgi:starch phosphorylase
LPPANVQDPERRDILEADLVFDTLEEEVVPLYYDREAGYPAEWVRRMKRAMMTVIPRFNMRRVLQDYAEGLYYPAAKQAQRLAEHEFAGARQLAEWKLRVRQLWPKVGLRPLEDQPTELPRGETLRMRIAASLNGLAPSDVCVEFIAKRLLPEANLAPEALSSYRPVQRNGLWRAELTPTGEIGADGALVYALDAHPSGSGRFSTEVRIYPRHELLSHPFELGLMKWL